MTSAAKLQRLEARIDAEKKETIGAAAAVQGLSLSDFVIQAAYSRALETLEAHRTLRLSTADQQLFMDTLMNPPAPNDALRQAAARSRERFGS
ncbi:DUF1778 domain-containing protein [Deinococcus sp. NW-56]|uniref:type II toxin-antitoxin system TacA family antitoxin n=1 Tax=Deinococcus sp. NW-56 TaxID=2080419 RepID=UPI000CF3D80D|nr:DUF1778 domain-containing protein [Deinococcus sp. NW-56]